MKNIYINEQELYKNLKKYIKKNDTIIHLLHKNYDIIDESCLENIDDISKETVYIIHALNLKSLEERYSYIYDKVCYMLDKEFMNRNICKFSNNKCIGVRHCHYKDSLFGCCRGPKRGKCKYLDGKSCSIKSISCKLFTCSYLRKNNIKFRVNDFLLLKYFFNPIQKYYLEFSLFKDKKEMIEILMKYSFKQYI